MPSPTRRPAAALSRLGVPDTLRADPLPDAVALRARSGARPICPEGDRFCGVLVWKADVSEYRRRL